jgi:signal transduction histidine kinase
MKTDLESLRGVTLEWISRQRACATLLLDSRGILQACDGKLDVLGLPTLELGQPIQDQLLFTEGLIPCHTSTLYLPLLQIGPHHVLDLHLYRVDGGYGMVLADATERHRLFSDWKQKLNAASLANHRLQQQTAGAESLLAELFGALESVVLRVEPTGQLTLAQPARPAWLELLPPLCGAASELPAAPDPSSSFIERFLGEARELWSGPRTGRLDSGSWTELDAGRTPHHFEAIALKTEHHRALIVSHDPAPRSEPAAEAHSLLDARVAERTARLQEANARLASELELRQRLERERAEVLQRIQQAQKMETIGTLAGGIAHDFNNILSAILGFTELSLLETDRDSVLRHNLEQVLGAACRARDLTRQILVFSRQSQPEKRPIQLASIIDETLALIQPSLPPGVTVRREVQSQSYVLAEPVQMHQVLMNLFTNAMHAMRAKPGTLSVALRETQLGDLPPADAGSASPPPGPYLELCVRDTGHGIAPGQLHRIFEPFYTTKKHDEGTGMGLAVVHGIIEDSGGTIRVQSQLGAGTLFTILLPAVEWQPYADAVDRARGPFEKARILLVSTGTARRALVTQMLDCMGYEVVPTGGGSEALARLESTAPPIDLVLCDLDADARHASTLPESIHRIAPRMPIIACSDYDADLSQPAGRDEHIAAHLVRPLILRELADVIRRTLHAA